MASVEDELLTKRFLKYDWDAVAGITAAFVAIIMHFLPSRQFL